MKVVEPRTPIKLEELHTANPFSPDSMGVRGSWRYAKPDAKMWWFWTPLNWYFDIWNPTVWSVRFLDFSRVDFFDTGFKNIGKMLEFLMQNTVTVQDNGISGEGSQLDIPSGSRLHQWEPNLIQHRICVFKNQIILPPMQISGGIDLYNTTFQGAGISLKNPECFLEKLQNDRF